MDRGWIKIYRSLLDWEWFDDAETVQLFIYLLVTANYEDKKWRGMVVERGQTIIGVAALAKRLGSTERRIRTRLEYLTNSGTISRKTTNRFTIVTICNYDSYQDVEEPQRQTDVRQMSDRCQTDVKQMSTPKEDKKIRSKEDKEEVANATSKKRAAKKGKGEGGEDPKPTNTPKTQKEAISEGLSCEADRLYPEGKKTQQSANLEPSGAEEAKSIDYEAIKSRWNEETGGALGKLVMITGRRREMVRARIRETSVDDFFTMIRNAASSSFLRGESQRGWVANFDWCIKPNNYPKVLEGRYNDNSEGEGVILPPNAKRVTDSSEGVDYRYIDFRELDKQHRR